MVSHSNTLQQTLSMCMVPRFHLLSSLLGLTGCSSMKCFYYFFIFIFYYWHLKSHLCKHVAAAMYKSQYFLCSEKRLHYCHVQIFNYKLYISKHSNIASLQVFWVAVVGG